jgi:MFS family permease
VINKKIKILLAANFVNNVGFSFFPPLFALFVAKFDRSPAMVGTAWAVNMFVLGIMILIFGRYENKLNNHEKLLVTGYLLMATGALCYLLVDNIWQLFAVQAFNAIGVGMSMPAFRTIFTKGEDKDKVTVEWSMADANIRFAIATGAIAGGLVLKYSGFDTLFILIAAFELMSAGIAMSLLNERKVEKTSDLIYKEAT